MVMNKLLDNASVNVNDVNSLNGIKALGREQNPESIRKIAQQFESMFVQMMMKTMRQSNEVFGQDNFLNSSENKIYQDMLDSQMSVNLSSGKGIGLADNLYKQLMQQYNLDWQEQEPGAGSMAENITAYRPAEQTFDFSSVRRVADRLPEPIQQAVNKAVEVGRKIAAQGMEHFVSELAPLAKKLADSLGLNEKALVAQAALETGWGKYIIADADGNSSHNLFNIKAKSGEAAIAVETTEYRSGLPLKERAEFKRYPDFEQSFADYGRLISGSERYQTALAQGKNSEAYVEQLQQAGYATDPNYAKKIKSILHSADFQRLWQ